MLPFALTIFAGAFLLFQVQPLIGKFILPWFGGSPSVWTTCMLFFQVFLLGGYFYSHWVSTNLSPRRQALVHGLILALAAAVFLPITPSESWKPEPGQDPTWRIALLLAFSLGLPYLVLSTTGPLLQAWYSLGRRGASPYRLYALSNVGSLSALLSYPFLVEPNFARVAQAVGWSWGFGAYALLCLFCIALMVRAAGGGGARSPGPAPKADTEEAAAPTAGTRLLWLGLSGCASLLLLSVTNQICQDIAVVPFLWILPLGLYLLSFVLCFDSEDWYQRKTYGWALALTVATDSYFMFFHKNTPILFQVVAYSCSLFIFCMFCHGELYRLKPNVRHLTSYYFTISVGGALGGLVVGLVAPLIFDAYYEMHLGLLGVSLLLLAVLFWDRNSRLAGGRPRWAWAGLGLGVIALSAALLQQIRRERENVLAASRNFYGVLRVIERDGGDPENRSWNLYHGGIIHGFQYRAAEKKRLPTSYFAPESGAGRAIERFPRQENRKMGVVGLGIGTLAAYGKSGDRIRFYEIDPAVRDFAQTHFSFLADSKAEIEIVMGDGRLSLEREGSQGFDLLFLDAFSGDSVPVHLLTREAFEIYLRHLKPDGVICAQISNRHLDLEPVLAGLASHFQLSRSPVIETQLDLAKGIFSSRYVLLTRDRALLDSLDSPGSGQAMAGERPELLWTDEKTSLMAILK